MKKDQTSLTLHRVSHPFALPLVIITAKECEQCHGFLNFIASDSSIDFFRRALDMTGHYSCPQCGNSSPANEVQPVTAPPAGGIK